MERVLYAARALPPLRQDVGFDTARFDDWVRERESARCQSSSGAGATRRLHVALIIDGPPPAHTVDSLLSLERQTSTSWTLTVVALPAWRGEVSRMLTLSGVRHRAGVRTPGPNTGFLGLLEEGLGVGRGDHLALMFPGDVWAPDAVLQLSAALTHGGMVYADEDCLDVRGTHVLPRLKPAFSPEFLLHLDCIGRPLALAADVVARLPAASALVAEAGEHDLALRAADVARTVRHIPEVLCHRRLPSPVMPTETPEGRHHVSVALARHGEEAATLPGLAPASVLIRRKPRIATTASIIIPFRDEPRFLRTCFDSIERTLGSVTPEYLLIDNGSEQPETATLLERLGSHSRVRILEDRRPFNWAVLNNTAAAAAASDVLVFLNNDIEALTPGWLDVLCAQACRSDVGAAGARLLYPDHRVQHCGVVLGMGGAAGHIFAGLGEDEPGYLGMAVTTRECSAVTGACLATSRRVFERLGGFDESLGVDLNDIDYCLRAWGSGLRVLYESTAELVHHESPSRGSAGGVDDIVLFIERWKACILEGDPYLNPNLTRVDSSCALREPSEEQWWLRWHEGLIP